MILFNVWQELLRVFSQMSVMWKIYFQTKAFFSRIKFIFEKPRLTRVSLAAGSGCCTVLWQSGLLFLLRRSAEQILTSQEPNFKFALKERKTKMKAMATVEHRQQIMINADKTLCHLVPGNTSAKLKVSGCVQFICWAEKKEQELKL